MPTFSADQYQIAYEDSGSGKPLLYLHGGPGTARDHHVAQLVDATRWRYITFDQRGCGQSTPLLCTDNNTTAHIISDIEQLRTMLDIESWTVGGGSWGTTLALAYAKQYPHRVDGLMLRGVFLCRPEDIEWAYRGARLIFPERYEAFNVHRRSTVEELMDDYADLLAGPEQLHYARLWVGWEDLLCGNPVSSMPDTKAIQMAVLEHHYLSNGGFLLQPLLEEIETIKHIPCEIVHGRYDFVCPVQQAYDLHQHLSQSRLRIIENVSHGTNYPAMAAAVKESSNNLLI